MGGISFVRRQISAARPLTTEACIKTGVYIWKAE
jgi:hypothetical protein